MWFQLTHLLRGVTVYNLVSDCSSVHFNSHTSCEVWQNSFVSNEKYQKNFNSHTSCEVWQTADIMSLHMAVISTHTPLARCDMDNAISEIDNYNFNSHTSCEVWLTLTLSVLDILNFNSHTSCEVWRTTNPLKKRSEYHFNSHTSCEVWQSSDNSTCFRSAFQLTHLLRGVT